MVPIEQHSLLSDQRTAALVTADARVVWLCCPRVDSNPLMAELLGGPPAGYFAVRPADPTGRPQQRYIDHSMVLETSWDGLTVTDYVDCSEGLPAEPAGRSRLVRVLAGSGRAVVEFAPRSGTGATRLERNDTGIDVRGGADSFMTGLRSPGLRWRIESNGGNDTCRADVDLAAGPVVLELLCGPGAGDDSTPEPERRSATIEHWSAWAGGLTLPPLQTDLVRRSALVLKALCHGPTGAIIAAPTTSLPQELGGSRNWDYRYCWMRDASMAASTLVRLGSTREAMDLLDWLLQLIEDGGADLDHLAPIYTVDGGALPPEHFHPHLPGYGGSHPVRIGNAAEQQAQTDVFGPIMELIWRLGQAGAPLDEPHWHLVEQLVAAVSLRWREPDQGIWEIRAEPRHHVHSKAMCWMAVDRGIAVARSVFGRLVPEWEQLRDTIAAEILSEGWNPVVGSFTAAYGSTDLDSAVLAVGLSGLIPPTEPRLSATVEAIEAQLRVGPTVYRYRGQDGLPGTPSGFNLMTSWLIDAKILIGDLDGARALFDDYAALAGPTGLMSEEHDPVTGEARGNFPQAYSHLGLIENALNLAEHRAR
ncbi:MAG: glycoside hydrolase family 15 protein [Acidimicrobiaceae bacterium]|nr:glycoside hydrolase family 15 protein [Acidimicrobiaceae bacterium]MYJ30810.1 glycoside hydrolase family 15 protein [Acidimicrobiaceae bacterium]